MLLREQGYLFLLKWPSDLSPKISAFKLGNSFTCLHGQKKKKKQLAFRGRVLL